MAVVNGLVFAPYVDGWGKYTSTGLASIQPIDQQTGGIAALDVNTGEVVWDKKLPSINVGGATVVNNLVFTATNDGMIYAFQAADGTQVFSMKAPDGINSWPAVSGDTIIWPCGYGGGTPVLLALKLGAPKPTATPTSTPSPSPSPSPGPTATPAGSPTPTVSPSPSPTPSPSPSLSLTASPSPSPTGQAVTVNLMA